MASKNHKKRKKRKMSKYTPQPIVINYDDNTVFVKDWLDLQKVESDTHFIEFTTLKGDSNPCSAHICPKEGYDMVYDGFDYKYFYYLSTHTFYGSNYKHSERALRHFGFNVKMNNWDAPGSGY